MQNSPAHGIGDHVCGPECAAFSADIAKVRDKMLCYFSEASLNPVHVLFALQDLAAYYLILTGKDFRQLLPLHMEYSKQSFLDELAHYSTLSLEQREYFRGVMNEAMKGIV